MAALVVLCAHAGQSWSQTHSKTVDVTDVSGRHKFRVTLTAPNAVDKRAIEYLSKMLRIVPASGATLRQWSSRGKSSTSDIVVNIASLDRSRPADFMLLPPDGFELSAPGRIRMTRSLYQGLQRARQYRFRALERRTTLRSSAGTSTTLSGKLRCRALNGTKWIYNDLPYAKVKVKGSQANADSSGNFRLTGRFGAGWHDLEVVFDAPVRSHSQSTPLRVMAEFHEARSENARVRARIEAGRAVVGNVTLTSVDCELFRLGAVVLDNYHRIAGSSPPARKLRLKRWSGVWDGIPYTYYDYIVLTTNFSQKGAYRTESTRRNTIFHEFGHSIRHVADGSELHWGWDNFRWAYARFHGGCEVYNTQYAFNEGWAGYWKVASRGGTSSAGCGYEGAFRDWTEKMITQHLLALANALPASSADERARKMVQVLTQNPGAIHSLWEFEVNYCKLHYRGNSMCRRSGVPTRARPKSCPPGFHDDGATCRLVNIKAKPSYGRGVGVVPTGCPASRPHRDAGLCYPRCRSGYKGVGPVCWQTCPSGFPDHGAFCGKPSAYGRGAGYPWQFGDPPFDLTPAKRRCERQHGRCEKHGLIYYPKCRAGFHPAGCCICSPNCVNGMKDIGVSCQKQSYGRGVGTIPAYCSAGMEKDAGLCYKKCRAGYKGVGPVCWGKCPAGFADHGATCYRPPNILVKY